MCATMVALPTCTDTCGMLFGKNSDRSPNEPQQLIFVPRKKHSEAEVRTTYRNIPQVQNTNAVLLLKSSWMWGCEMGVNEHGLTVGNEDVFTKFKSEASTLIGTDFVRLVLERCQTAREGADLICTLLQQYGQGGNCGYDRVFSCDSSYLIADAAQAWVVETAGSFWAKKQVVDVAAISNRLSLENDYDEIHPGAVEYALRKKWCRSVQEFGFTSCFASPLRSKLSKGYSRRSRSMEKMQTVIGMLTPTEMREFLRSHEERVACAPPLTKSSIASVCTHAGGGLGNHSTGSFVAQIDAHNMQLWATGASTPCFSIFKPIDFAVGGPVFAEKDEALSTAYWMQREKLYRAALRGYINIPAYLAVKSQLEESFEHLQGDLPAIVSAAHAQENEFIACAIKAFAKKQLQPLGNVFYQQYWRRKNVDLLKPRKL